MRVRVLTLGCKVNQCDSEAIAAELARRGFPLARDEESADLLLVNTCTVTQVADAKARKLVRRLIRQRPGRPVIVVGCGARLAGSTFAEIPGVFAVVAGHDPEEVAEAVKTAAALCMGDQDMQVGNPPRRAGLRHCKPTPRANARTRAFLKVQEGCAHQCAYCIVPQAR